jgi:hypothetical protein
MNNRLKLYLLVVVTIFSLVSCDNSDDVDPTNVFIKYYGSRNSEVAVDLLALPDGYLILGQRSDNATSSYYLIRTDLEGNNMWDNTFTRAIKKKDQDGNEINEQETVVSIPTSMRLYDNDTKAVLIGTSITTTDDYLFLVDVDLSSGDSIRSKLYQYEYEHPNGDTLTVNTLGADVLPYNGGFIILGTIEATVNVDSENIGGSALLTYFGSDWSTVDWSTVLYSTLCCGNSDDFGFKLLEGRGSYYFVASTSTDKTTNTGLDVVISNFNPDNGGFDATPTYRGDGGDDVPNNLLMTADGNSIVVTGTTIDKDNPDIQHAFVLQDLVALSGGSSKTPNRLTFSGTLNSQPEEWKTRGYDIVEKSDNQFIVAGSVLNYEAATVKKREDIVLMPTFGTDASPSENPQAFGSVGDDAANAIIKREDGSLVIAATVDFDGEVTMISLLKTNNDGKLKK